MLGYTRQAYYKNKQCRLKRYQELIQVKNLIMRVRGKMPRIGTRKLYFLIKEELNQLCIKIGRDVLFKFLKAEGLLVVPKRSYTKTTNSKHWMKKYPDKTQNLNLSRPEQLWVSDITYIKTQKGYNYLSLVTDAYSKRIMGYDLQENLSTIGPLNALTMALKNRQYDLPIIHHSDRGLQYCSAEYTSMLTNHGISISMTQNGDPYENAVAERINGILKYEFLMTEGFKNHIEAIQAIKNSVHIYNTYRPHLSCNMMVPAQTHQQNTMVLKKWKKKPRTIKSEV